MNFHLSEFVLVRLDEHPLSFFAHFPHVHPRLFSDIHYILVHHKNKEKTQSSEDRRWDSPPNRTSRVYLAHGGAHVHIKRKK
jgi:hypothetical protein